MSTKAPPPDPFAPPRGVALNLNLGDGTAPEDVLPEDDEEAARIIAERQAKAEEGPLRTLRLLGRTFVDQAASLDLSGLLSLQRELWPKGPPAPGPAAAKDRSFLLFGLLAGMLEERERWLKTLNEKDELVRVARLEAEELRAKVKP